MSKTIKAGCVFGLIGGIVAMIGLVLFFEAEESAVVTMAVYMLVAVLFFAIAGAFGKHSQWSWKVLMFMDFVTLGIVIGGAVAEYFDVWWAVVEAAIGVILVVISNTSGSRTWLSEPRTA